MSILMQTTRWPNRNILQEPFGKISRTDLSEINFRFSPNSHVTPYGLLQVHQCHHDRRVPRPSLRPNDRTGFSIYVYMRKASQVMIPPQNLSFNASAHGQTRWRSKSHLRRCVCDTQHAQPRYLLQRVPDKAGSGSSARCQHSCVRDNTFITKNPTKFIATVISLTGLL